MAPRSNGESRQRPRWRHRPAPEGLEPRQLLSGAFPPAIPIPMAPPGHTFELQSLTGDDGADTTSRTDAEYRGPVLSASERAMALAADGTYQIKGIAVGFDKFPHNNSGDIEVNFQVIDATNPIDPAHPTILSTTTDRVVKDFAAPGDQREVAFTIHLPASVLAQDGARLFKILFTNKAAPLNISAIGYPFLIDVDTSAPAVTSVTSPAAGQTFKAGDSVPIAVNFGEPIAYTPVANRPAPTLLLATSPQPRLATFTGAGPSSLNFSYVVQPGDLANPLNYASTSALDLQGNRLQDSAGNDASLTLPPPTDPSRSLASANVVVDTSLAAGAPPLLLPDDDSGPSQSDHITSATTNLRFVGKAADDVTQVTVNLYRRNPDGTSDLTSGAVATVTSVPDAAHNYTATMPGPIAPGLYNVVAVFTDRSGNMSPATLPMAPPLRIDTSPPAALSVDAISPGSGSVGNFLTNKNTGFTLGGGVSNDPDDPAPSLTVALLSADGSHSFGQVNPRSDRIWALPYTGPALTEGPNAFLVRATDPAGNAIVARANVVLDTKAPAIGKVSVANPLSASSDLALQTLDPSPVLTVPVTDQAFAAVGNTVNVTVASSGKLLAQGVFPVGANGAIAPQFKLVGLPAGLNTLQIKVRDAAGNETTGPVPLIVGNPTGQATYGAPGTPVYTKVFDIAQSLKNNGTIAADGDPADAPEHPWTIAFDKTTQTLWADLRGGDPVGGPTGGGDRVIQIDPATDSYKLYDLQSKALLDQHEDYHLTADRAGNPTGGSGPHGIFFDFESHLTPRVWFTQEQGGKFSYIDIAKNQLVSYDIKKLLDENGYRDHDGEPATGGVHAVVVDRRGVVWISDQDDNLILELDPRNGDSLDNATATLTVHKIPDNVIPKDTPLIAADGKQLGPHGLDSVVDDRSGQAIVYVSLLGNGHILRLIPGDAPGTSDQWTDYDTGAAKGVGDPNLGASLFPVIDNQETPLDPSDDRIYWGDTGGQENLGTAKNLIRELDPNTGTITTWTVPPIPGSKGTSQPNQVYLDREGNVFYIDRQSGVGRLDPANRLEKVFVESKPVDMSTLTVAPGPAFALDHPVIYDLGAIPSQPLVVVQDRTQSTPDRSTAGGLDQYDVRGESSGGGRGQGPFRGTINAGSNLYASLTQNDEISVTTFAETSRRQMTVVNDEGTATAPGTGRMAFQVLRDGSLVMTGRSTPDTSDQQTNLTAAIGGPRFYGDVSAVTDAAGTTHVFGRDLDTGGLTQYLFNPNASPQWSFQRLSAVPGAVLAANPAAFLDSVRGAGAMVTTNTGHLLVYYPAVSAAPIDLTLAAAPDKLVYSTVAVTEVGGRIYADGTDQKGDLIEYSYDANAGPSSISPADVRFIINVSAPANTFPAVFQDVEVVADGDTRHLFVTDGNSQLVHVELTPGRPTFVENVTLGLDKGPGPQINGYADYQRPYAGRVYSELAALVDPLTHDLYVYGTNGRDLIQFHRPAGGAWQVRNLTNNISGDANLNLPANQVFGAPAAYILPDGSQHVLQINEEGEVVEFYQLGRGGIFTTQNINLSQAQLAAPPASNPAFNLPAGQTRKIGPRATPLVPTDPAATSFLGVGVIQNTRDRASFRFVATHSGLIVFNLRSPFAILELDTYNRHGRRIQRSRNAVKVTDALGNTYYQNQVALNVVAGQAYSFLVRGTPQRRHPGIFGFGNFTLMGSYVQVTDGQAASHSRTRQARHPRGPLHGRLPQRHRAGLPRSGRHPAR